MNRMKGIKNGRLLALFLALLLVCVLLAVMRGEGSVPGRADFSREDPCERAAAVLY